MILLDTHVWIWWVQGDPMLQPNVLSLLDNPTGETGVHIISCWEVAMLHSRDRLVLPCSLDDWLDHALRYPGVRQIPLTRTVAVDSCRLKGKFHKDPADRILVAAANELDCTQVTADEKILDYQNVRTVHPCELGN